MTVSELKKLLNQHPDLPLELQLPNGETVPPHFHVTEVAFSKKDFIDCGGTIRHEEKCLLQIWVANDVEHRVNSTTLANILVHGAPVLPTEALPIEIEYMMPGLTLLPLIEAKAEGGKVILRFEHLNTDCLAKDVCGITPENDACAPASGCG